MSTRGADEPVRPYQARALAWLRARGGSGLLALPMGSGKTRVAIEVARGLGMRYMLVVAPKVALASWELELARWWPEVPCTSWQGTPAARARRWTEYLERGGVLLVNYALLGPLALCARSFGLVIYDESHQLRNRKTGVFAHARRLRSPHILELTGSPIVNGAEDLWTQLYLLDHARFRSFWTFARAYLRIQQDRYGTHLVGIAQPEALQADTAPYLFRLTREEVLGDLPPKTRQLVPVRLGAEQRRIYDELVDKLLAFVGNDRYGEQWLLAPNTVALLTRLRQVIVCPQALGANCTSTLLDALAELAQQSYREGRPLLVFSPFAQGLVGAAELLASYGETYVLQGGLSAAELGRRVAAFADSPSPARALLCTTALGTSFSATAASTVVFLGTAWTPAANTQCEDRASRLGQRSAVAVYYLVGEETVDQHILAILDQKTTWARLALDPAMLLRPHGERRERFAPETAPG